MTGIIILIIFLAIAYGIAKYLIEEHGGLVLIGIVCVVAFLAFSWKGVLGLFLVAGVGALAIFLVWMLTEMVKGHDKEKKDIANMYQNAQHNKEVHDNEMALQYELDKNCRYLGCMDESRWKEKLPNYVNKRYTKSFREITQNFTRQMELQNIVQNDDWFQPFLEYIIAHPQGFTVTKILNEVHCPQFNITHETMDYKILNDRLIKGTKRVSRDVPPIFNTIDVPGETLFVLSQYGRKLYDVDQKSETNESMHQKEINFDEI